MKITLITQHLEGQGGTEKVIAEVLNHDLNNSYQVLVPSSGSAPDWLQWITRLNDYQVKIYQNSNIQERNQQISQEIWQFKPDIVLGLEGKALQLAERLRKTTNINYCLISWSHTSLVDGGFFKKEDLACADYHLAISSGLKQQLIDYGAPVDKIFLIFNPVIQKKAALISTPAVGQPFHPVFIGRMILDGSKNVRMLLNSLMALSIPWELEMFGKGYDFTKIKQFIAAKGLEQKVQLHGWVPDPWKTIREADCLLLSSNYEGFPLVLLEAISRGLPLISTDCPTGPADLITEENGLLVPVNDTMAFTKACTQLYHGRSHFDHHQIQQASQKFDITAYIKHLNQIFQSVALK